MVGSPGIAVAAVAAVVIVVAVIVVVTVGDGAARRNSTCLIQTCVIELTMI